MKSRMFASATAGGSIGLAIVALLAAWSQASAAQPATSIDGTYELTKHVMPNGTVVRPPLWTALYTMRSGRFSLNLFFKKPDGMLASESTIGRYTFTLKKYCEWITYTTRNNLDQLGVTNAAPVLKDHCAPVALKGGLFRFSPPGEGVMMTVGAEGFTAKIDGGGVDYWTKIR